MLLSSLPFAEATSVVSIVQRADHVLSVGTEGHYHPLGSHIAGGIRGLICLDTQLFGQLSMDCFNDLPPCIQELDDCGR